VAWLTARVLGRCSQVCWACNQITCQRVFSLASWQLRSCKELRVRFCVKKGVPVEKGGTLRMILRGAVRETTTEVDSAERWPGGLLAGTRRPQKRPLLQEAGDRFWPGGAGHPPGSGREVRPQPAPALRPPPGGRGGGGHRPRGARRRRCCSCSSGCATPTIRALTDRVLQAAGQLRQRPLPEGLAPVYLDGLLLKVLGEEGVGRAAVYVALGVTPAGGQVWTNPFGTGKARAPSWATGACPARTLGVEGLVASGPEAGAVVHQRWSGGPSASHPEGLPAG